MFLLDITAVSDYLRGNAKVIENLSQTLRSKVYISSITKLEIAYGINKKPQLKAAYDEQIFKLYAWSQDISFCSDAAVLAGAIKHDLVSNGKTIGIADVMIGAIALNKDFTVITSNVKHFERIKGLKIKDWK